MSYIMAGVAAGGAVMQFAGSMSAASAAKRAGRNQQIAAAYQAQQMEQQAGQSVAASQRAAMEEERKARLMASRAVAVAAAGGGGTSDFNTANIIGDIFGEGAYRASVALYQGEEKARQLRMGADAKELDGQFAMSAANDAAKAIQIKGLGQAIQSGASMYGKYGMGGPGLVGEQVPGQYSLTNPAYG
jgi:hypothetical protein